MSAPSKAAYELGKSIREKYIAANPAEQREEINQDIAQMCQSALADLLEGPSRN